jgi:hypothetical protein
MTHSLTLCRFCEHALSGTKFCDGNGDRCSLWTLLLIQLYLCDVRCMQIEVLAVSIVPRASDLGPLFSVPKHSPPAAPPP